MIIVAVVLRVPRFNLTLTLTLTLNQSINQPTNLCRGILHQKLEVLVPHRGSVPTSMAGVVISSRLQAKRQRRQILIMKGDWPVQIYQSTALTQSWFWQPAAVRTAAALPKSMLAKYGMKRWHTCTAWLPSVMRQYGLLCQGKPHTGRSRASWRVTCTEAGPGSVHGFKAGNRSLSREDCQTTGVQGELKQQKAGHRCTVAESQKPGAYIQTNKQQGHIHKRQHLVCCTASSRDGGQAPYLQLSLEQVWQRHTASGALRAQRQRSQQRMLQCVGLQHCRRHCPHDGIPSNSRFCDCSME